MNPCSNQTNLAIKGIIGLKAMSQIANLTGNPDKWGSTADDYLVKWRVLGVNNNSPVPHTTLSYGDNSSHGKPTLTISLPSTSPSAPPSC